MKRSFRVATLFTGAAAFTGAATFAGAAVGAAPTVAHAAPAADGALGKVTPDGKAVNCNALYGSTSMALVLQYAASQHHSKFACVGPTSTSPSPVALGNGKAKFASYCDPKFDGYMWIKGVKHAFTKGVHNLYGQNVSKVSFTTTGYPGDFCTLNGAGNPITYY